MQQTHIAIIAVVGIIVGLLIGNAFGQGAYSSSQPNHPLQQISTNSSSGTSVDDDGDGIIDSAEDILVDTVSASFTGTGQLDCGGTTAVSGGCKCQGKNIQESIPILNAGTPIGWSCACEGGGEGELFLTCTR